MRSLDLTCALRHIFPSSCRPGEVHGPHYGGYPWVVAMKTRLCHRLPVRAGLQHHYGINRFDLASSNPSRAVIPSPFFILASPYGHEVCVSSRNRCDLVSLSDSLVARILLRRYRVCTEPEGVPNAVPRRSYTPFTALPPRHLLDVVCRQ